MCAIAFTLTRRQEVSRLAQIKQCYNGLFPESVRRTVTNITKHEVSKSAAALTYYLLFAMFPLLIFVSNLLGLLDLNVESISNALSHIIPNDVVDLLEAYLYHVTENSSQVMLWFSLVFTVWFPLRAVRSLMDDVRIAYQLGRPSKPVLYAIRYFLFTIVFLVIIIVLFLLAVLGRRFVLTVIAWLGLTEILRITPALLNIWQYLRFVLLAAIMFAVLGLLYAAAQDERQPAKSIMPGAAIALAAWLLVSVGFSVYVENFANYSVIYGTLGAVIVLMVWLYMTSFILILGAEYNAALAAVRKETAEVPIQSVSL